MIDSMLNKAQEYYEDMIQLRRHFHMYPELSFKEVKTPEYIAEYLRSLDIDVREGVGGRGVVGILNKDKSGPTLAIRADFDALPIQDEKEVPYKSTIEGVSHACGHDAHTAVLLTTARILAEHRDQINGRVVFIHQHAEEVDPGGAIQMIADGCLNGVDAIIGQHVSSSLDVGKVGYKYGTTTGIPDDFWITLKGKGGHAAHPDELIDPLAAGFQLCNDLQYIVSRKTNALNPAVLSITMFHAGETNNVIPDTCKIGGTIRTFDADTQNKVIEGFKKVLEGIQEMTDVTYDLKYSKGYPPVFNTEKETDLLLEAAKEVKSVKELVELEASLGGEDFSYYQQKVPGAFFYTGTRNENFKADFPHHHPKFDIDESGLLNAVKIFLITTVKFMERSDYIESN